MAPEPARRPDRENMMDALSRLVAAEEIRNTKGAYWYYLDTKDWARMATVFTEDAIFDMREEVAFGAGQDPGVLKPVEEAIAQGDPAVTVGGQAFAEMLSVALRNWKTVHHGHAPIIEIEALGSNEISCRPGPRYLIRLLIASPPPQPTMRSKYCGRNSGRSMLSSPPRQ